MMTPLQRGNGIRLGRLRLQAVLLSGLTLAALASLTGCGEKTLPEKEVVRRRCRPRKMRW